MTTSRPNLATPASSHKRRALRKDAQPPEISVRRSLDVGDQAVVAQQLEAFAGWIPPGERG